jgi:hypothetical protein
VITLTEALSLDVGADAFITNDKKRSFYWFYQVSGHFQA